MALRGGPNWRMAFRIEENLVESSKTVEGAEKLDKEEEEGLMSEGFCFITPRFLGGFLDNFSWSLPQSGKSLLILL